MVTIKKCFLFLIIGITCLLIGLSVLSLFYNNSSIWWIKILNFPRSQGLFASVISLLLIAFFIKKQPVIKTILLIGLVASISINASFVIAYTPLVEKQVLSLEKQNTDSGALISLLIANVHITNKDARAFINLALDKNPDLVLVMETNTWWQKALQPLRQRYPYYIEYPLEDSYGMMLYSKYKLEKPEIKFFVHNNVPSIHTKVRLLNGRQFYFRGVHPVPPVPSGKYPDNIGGHVAAGELRKIAELVTKESLPTVVAGDFNDVAWSDATRLFKKNSLLKDVREGRGLYNSFDARSFILRWPLDHIFVTKDFKLVSLERLGKFGSDHFPIYAQLALMP